MSITLSQFKIQSDLLACVWNLVIADTATALQTLSISQANLTDAKQTKIALGALITFLMKKRGAAIERAEAEDTEAAVAAMVEVAATHHRQVKSFDKVILNYLNCIYPYF